MESQVNKEALLQELAEAIYQIRQLTEEERQVCIQHMKENLEPKPLNVALRMIEG